MRALLLDVGNSTLKWGLFEGEGIHRTGQVKLNTIPEQWLSALASELPSDVDLVVACNVAGPEVAEHLSALFKSHSGLGVRFIHSEARACDVTSSYHQPGDLGVGRWVTMIGARASCTEECVIVDVGTAITIDALDADGIHLGGLIIPGLSLMADSLRKYIDDFESLDKKLTSNGGRLDIFANTPTAEISEGVFGAAVGAVERSLHVLRQNGFKPTLMLTGRDAALLQGLLHEEAQLHENLALEGLVCILKESA